MATGRVETAVCAHIQRIPGLDEVNYSPATGLSLGTLVTIRTLELHPLIQEHYPALAQAATTFAGVQIRNLATVGGNICNASPAGDTLPALLAYGAECRLVGPEGERLVPLESFFLGPGRTALRPAELLVELHLPPPPPHTGALYIKHSPRSAMDISTVGVASVVTLEGQHGVCQEVRIALGAVAPTVIRARSAEALLRGQRLEAGLIQQAAQAAARMPGLSMTSGARRAIGAPSLRPSPGVRCDRPCRWPRAPAFPSRCSVLWRSRPCFEGVEDHETVTAPDH